MKLSKKETIIVIILGLLTAMVALSIDLYLPAFKIISEDLKTDMGNVQISLSVFLGGMAVGQPVWGTLSDRMGRKKPIIIALLIYILASALVLTVDNIRELWFYRFMQAFSGSAGAVVARAVVTDMFDKHRTTGIFSVLALTSGLAPILAPGIGNLLLSEANWHNIFIAMAVFGIFVLFLVLLQLPETFTPGTTSNESSQRSIYESYKHVFNHPQFRHYMGIGSLTFTALMIYISGSPFLIMEKGGFTRTQYSLIFGANAIGMMMGTYATNRMVQHYSRRILVKYALLVQLAVSLLFTLSAWMNLSILLDLVFIFLFLTMTGILLTSTTDLALEPFRNDSGTASAVFGFAQLAVTFLFSGAISLLQNNSVLPMAASLLICAGIASFTAGKALKSHLSQKNTVSLFK